MANRVRSRTATGGGAATPVPPPPTTRQGGSLPRLGVLAVFLGPAFLLLGALVIYPIFFSFFRSFFDANGQQFVGLENYGAVFTSERTRTALRNNLIWVVFAPTFATVIGLVFAVLTERIKWTTAFKVAVFMPMAISLLASGIIWRFMYELNPNIGLLNASVRPVVEFFNPPGDFPGARPSDPTSFTVAEDGALVATAPVRTGTDDANAGLVAIPAALVPEEAERARQASPTAGSDAIAGVVWLDFTPGGGGELGEIDAAERGLPGVKVDVLDADGALAGNTRTDVTGAYVVDGLEPGSYTVRLAESNFRPAFAGISWLGPALVTPAIIASFLWIWAGFAMVVIGAGLSALPRELLEAARVDGANEWQVFRKVTIPLLMPVITVVLVTLAINVLKIFDLVLIIPPGSSQDNANVLALEMWRVSFGGGRDEGLGSALAMLIFALVIPAMMFNFRRFRAEQN